jgi:hypothetical protein
MSDQIKTVARIGKCTSLLANVVTYKTLTQQGSQRGSISMLSNVGSDKNRGQNPVSVRRCWLMSSHINPLRIKAYSVVLKQFNW